MIKVGIQFDDLEEESYYDMAKQLQRFIVEDSYALSAIVEQLQAQKMVVLDVSREEYMPDLTTLVEELEEEEIAYQLFKAKNNDWDACEISDLDLVRDRWLVRLLMVTVLGYFIFSCFEIFAIYDWFTTEYEMYAPLAVVVAGVTAFIPSVGSVFAYFGATELWHWNSIFVLCLYFWYYLPVLGGVLYFLWLIFWVRFKETWYDFWNPEFRG